MFFQILLLLLSDESTPAVILLLSIFYLPKLLPRAFEFLPIIFIERLFKNLRVRIAGDFSAAGDGYDTRFLGNYKRNNVYRFGNAYARGLWGYCRYAKGARSTPPRLFWCRL